MADRELACKLLKDMILIRKFEESVQYYFSLGMIHGTTHLCIGEEATAAGSCAALQKEDAMFATHRGHGQSIAKGVDVNRMMAELFGKETGICKGRGGSMHFADPEVGAMGTNGVVGPSMALAAGAALARKMRGESSVAAAFFGDGATNEGIFHETLNLASVWKLPVLFICENNLYGMSTHISRVMTDTNIADRAIPYKMQAMTVDGNDVEAVYETVSRARDMALAGPEPVLIVENTYRISGHSKSDGNLYRTREEIRAWKAKDPIRLYEDKLLASGTLTKEDFAAFEAEADEQVAAAVRFATGSNYPDPADVYRYVYAE